ncbi:hypothetical protein F2Q68_00039188 [Brassica cretica]|uniref:Aspartic peptidase DDI1-type domain-containing protein n=1 Tax=Brassica cretica TaxID=69181 RepID=A0A8S9MLQ4_BRACR|nr:hypothetical protein F2Q68_00039188 [Brassica cretica]
MTHEEFAEKHPHPPSPFYVKIDRPHEPTVDRQRETDIDRPPSPPIDRRAPLTYRVRSPSIDSNRINALIAPPKPLANPPEPTTNPSDTTPEPMEVDEAAEGRVFRKRKEKIPKHLKREANEKEMDGFTKRVLRIPVKKHFDEVYYTHRLWMFFTETKETEEDIRRMFNHVRERMKLRITLKKKNHPGKFAIPFMVKGIEFLHALCDTGTSVSILPKVMADQLGLKIEPSSESFTFVDLSERSSGGIIRDLEVQIGNAFLPVDFHIMDIKLNWNTSLQHGRAFLATVGAICDMNTNRLCLTLIDPDVHHDLVLVVRQHVNLVELGNYLGYIAACHCGAEYKTEYSESIDTQTITSIDSNESPTTDERYSKSLDGKQPVDHSTSTDQYYPDFAFQQPNKNGRDDYSIGSWVDSGFPESFAVETVILSSNDDPTEEYDDDYWKERATEIPMQDERYSTQSLNNTPPPSIDIIYSASVDSHPHPAKRSSSSINTTPGTSFDIKATTLEKEKGNITIPSRDQDGHARAMDRRILQVSREDIADILQLANGANNLFMQQRSIPDNNLAVLAEYPRATTTGIGSHQSCGPGGQASIDKVASTSYGGIKFRWEQKDEYGVYRDECGYARSVAGEMIPVTKNNIRNFLERASLFGESHICLPEHAFSFTPTRLAP